MNEFNLTVGQDDHGRRIDRILRKAFKDFPLSFIHRLIRKKQVLINTVPAKMNDRVQQGDILSIKASVEMPEARIQQKAAAGLPPLTVLYENSGLLFVNKPAGTDVHGAESLETLVRSYLADKLPASLSFTPGPLHRLDKPTSGIIAFSKSLEGARAFSEALQTRKIKKYYLALMDGRIEKKELWEDTLYRDHEIKKTLPSNEKGQKAIMTVHPLISASKYTLGFIELETGRTHQIRAQGSIHRHPLAGDKKYGGSFLQGGFFLHAVMLSIPSDIIPDLPSVLSAPLPLERKSMLITIFGDKIKNLYEKNPHHSILDGIL